MEKNKMENKNIIIFTDNETITEEELMEEDAYESED